MPGARGFSDGQAESLRRAMSRKRSKEALVAHWEDFREGAYANGVDETTAREIFAQVTAFSEFGFPKSHASAFALLAYQSAWLRHYYPVEFYVGLFNNQPMGFYSLDALGRDARRHGLKTLLPDVNLSGVECTAEEHDLRVGLGFVRGWGAEIAEKVVEERRDTRPVPLFGRLPAPYAQSAQASGGGKPHLGGWIRGLRAHTTRTALADGPLARPRDRRGTLGRPRRPRSNRTRARGSLRRASPSPTSQATDRMIAEYRMLRFSAELHPLTLLQNALPTGTVSSDRLQAPPSGEHGACGGPRNNAPAAPDSERLCLCVDGR